MARNKAIEYDELIRILEEYRMDNPGVVIKIPEFGKYLRSRGYEVQDYTIRRNKQFREYISGLNKESAQKKYTDLVTYRMIDADKFIEKNCTKDKLKKALIERDRYYANVAANAVQAIDERKKLQRENINLKESIEKINEELKKKNDKINSMELRKKDEAIKTLKGILESYIYPDAANALLKREGIFEIVNSIIPEEVIDEKIIHVDTDIKKSKFDTVDKMLKEFEDE